MNLPDFRPLFALPISLGAVTFGSWRVASSVAARRRIAATGVIGVLVTVLRLGTLSDDTTLDAQGDWPPGLDSILVCAAVSTIMIVVGLIRRDSPSSR